ncbi:U3 small nucleolar RNA-associated protein 25 [Trichomonascus vanleenenianus]|uniref:rRNA-binding ribosome biosynthesis protein UTP25 n=1 Tax=Trichomonascus vanleenenianus TaxID=2268995 RepID=UPI003ECB00C1
MAKRSGEGFNGSVKKRRNTGRRTLRSAAGEKDHSDKREDQPQQVEEDNALEEAEEPEEQKIDAYNALLTLLKSEEPEEPKKKKKKANPAKKDDEEIEGYDEDMDQAEEVEEEEEEEEEEQEIVIQDDNEGDSKDPFEYHFYAPQETTLSQLRSVSFKPSKQPSNPLGNRSIAYTTDCTEKAVINTTNVSKLPLKYRLIAPFEKFNGEFSQLQGKLAGPVFSYQDLLYTGHKYTKATEAGNLYSLHLLNHIYKTRDRVLKNNAKLSAASQNCDEEVEFRDQGFTRPKALVLLPTRNACYHFIENLVSISGLSQVENKKRFKTAFFDDATPPDTKPEDFKSLFSGNTDDMFCLGVKFTRQAIKLYTSFYSSDLLVASPLGLRMIIGDEGVKGKKQDFDFLSSVELAIVDQADKMLMQKWEHVEHIFKHMNRIPKEAHDCDFSRVRNWYLDDNAKYMRQTLILTEFLTPEINSLFSKYCHNVIGGKLKTRSTIKDQDAALAQVGMRIRQTFTRINPSDPVQDPEVRFKHFTGVVLPSLMRGTSYNGTLIFVPSYLDFVRLRNYMDENNISCACVSEYSTPATISRARTFFVSGRTKMMMITERLHHFRRYEIKGVNQVVMYSVPENPIFYKETIRFMARTHTEANVSVDLLKARIIYSKWDSIKLERIVGTNRVGVLLEGVGDTYEFQ